MEGREGREGKGREGGREGRKEGRREGKRRRKEGKKEGRKDGREGRKGREGKGGMEGKGKGREIKSSDLNCFLFSSALQSWFLGEYMKTMESSTSSVSMKDSAKSSYLWVVCVHSLETTRPVTADVL